MNKKILFSILFVFVLNLLATGLSKAQVYDIPTPQCVHGVAGIPCPDDKNIDLSKLQKTQTPPSQINNKNNQLFIDLQNSVNNLMKYLRDLKIKDNLENLYNKLHTFFDSWREPIFDKKTK